MCCNHMQGRNVVLESKYGSPRIVNDGVTVAKEVELEDPVENIGAKLVRQVSWMLVWNMKARCQQHMPYCHTPYAHAFVPQRMLLFHSHISMIITWLSRCNDWQIFA